MDHSFFQKIGLNANEAKVYLALVKKSKATASELVKSLGVHRSIIYDNIEKLIEKGLVSSIIDGSKKRFIAESPDAIVEFLENQKQDIDNSISLTKKMIPEIKKMLKTSESNQEASIFRGIKGIKKALLDVIKSDEYWCIGLTNESIHLLGEIFWRNYTLKRRENNCKENILLNHDFKDVFGVEDDRLSKYRIMPKELNQVSEIMIYDDNVLTVVYGNNPVAFLIEDRDMSKTFRTQFDFLWKMSKPLKMRR